VRARIIDKTLYLSIRDDGTGGADSRKGSAILGLKDRVEVLGGKMTVSSPVGGGTVIDRCQYPTCAAWLRVSSEAGQAVTPHLSDCLETSKR
jgi:signal transduction histidine kinase